MPQTKGDYQYPWSKVGAAPNNAKYFASQRRQQADLVRHQVGQVPADLRDDQLQVQYRRLQPAAEASADLHFRSNKMGCVPTVPGDLHPPGCNTNRAHGPPGLCTKGPECSPARATTPRVVGKNGRDTARKAARAAGAQPARGCALGVCPLFQPTRCGHVLRRLGGRSGSDLLAEPQRLATRSSSIQSRRLRPPSRCIRTRRRPAKSAGTTTGRTRTERLRRRSITARRTQVQGGR